jgi:serine/threonine protein kinase
VQKTVTEACINVLQLCLEVNPKKRITMEELAEHPWINKNIFAAKIEDEKPKIMEPIK